MDMIVVDRLAKRFGRSTALDGVSLTVPVGSIFGLVGAAGAGKTSLLRILATLLEADAGDARINGASVRANQRAVRAGVGYMPAAFGVYPDMTALEYLEFFAGCFEVPVDDRAQLAADLLQLVDLVHRKAEQVDRLSRGMKQRLAIARILVHDPLVLLLDEPASDLDPRARVEMRELIRELQSMGKTIVLTSQTPGELDDLCTHIAIIEAGKINAAGRVEEIRGLVRPYRVIRVKFLGDLSAAMEVAREAPGVVDVKPYVNPNLPPARPDSAHQIVSLQHLDVTFRGDYNAASHLLRALVRGSVQVVSFHERTDSLEPLLVRHTHETGP